MSNRPSSAMSRSSSSLKATPRRRSNIKDEDFIYDCKAAYHVVFDDTSDEIESKDQLAEVLQQSGRNPSRKMIYKYWKDKNISFDEFCDICAEIPKTSTDDLLKAFKRVDVNGDGFISNKELRRMLTMKGERMTEDEVQSIIDEVDENGDGKLDYKEFCKFLLSTQEEVKKLGAEKMERKKKGKNYGRSHDSISNVSKSSQSSKRPGSEIGSDEEKENKDVDEKVPRDPSPTGSQASLRSQSNSLSRSSREAVADSPRELRGKSNVKPAIADKSLELTKPKRLKDWQTQSTKGSFLFDEDNTIVSHQYKLKLPSDSSVWITIEPGKQGTSGSHRDAPVDTMLYLLREDNSIITFTEQRDERGKYGVRCDLDRGSYRVVPFTTGCRFKRRREEADDEAKLIKKNKEGEIVLTKQFKDTLTEIFHLSDLDGDGLLSREEFSMYNLRVSGEEVSDEEWEVVEENVELEDSKLTLDGFLKLNQMEAEDTEGDPEELWVTLSSWGYNKELKQDEACPFTMEVYVEDCNFDLSVIGIKPGGRSLETAIIEATKGKGESRKIKDKRDLYLHTYQTDFKACYVVENKSNSEVSVTLDYSKCKNNASNRKGKSYTVDVPKKSVVVALHLMPLRESDEWTLNVQESIGR